MQAPSLNLHGRTAFLAGLQGAETDSSNNAGVWSEASDGVLKVLARKGDEAPDGFPRIFRSFTQPRISDTGRTIFRSRGDFGSDEIWSHGANQELEYVASVGAQDAALSRQGKVAFRTLNASQPYLRVWSDRGGDELVQVSWADANTVPETGGAQLLFGHSPLVNHNGQLAFKATLQDPTGRVLEDGHSIVAENEDFSLRLVAREGEDAPGTIAAQFTTDPFGNPTINGQGQTAFNGFLRGPNIDDTNNVGIWTEGSGTGLELLARKGSIAPQSGGAVFSTLSRPVLNNLGQVAFVGTVTGDNVEFINDRGIWSQQGRERSLSLVARENDPAPGTAGALFSNLSLPTLNSAGQLAFFGTVRGAEVTSRNDGAIWAQDLAGEFQLIAREGEPFDVSDDPTIPDLRIIRSLSFLVGTGNEDGRPSGFNDRGQLAFAAAFTDGSEGIFVSNLVAVPEPSTLLMALFAVVSLAAGRDLRPKVASIPVNTAPLLGSSSFGRLTGPILSGRVTGL